MHHRPLDIARCRKSGFWGLPTTGMKKITSHVGSFRVGYAAKNVESIGS